MKKLILIISLLSTVLIGCTTQYIQPQALTPQDSAKIVISRPSSFFAGAMSAPIYVNNKFIGKVGSGGQLTWVTPPGPITVSTSKSSGSLMLENNGSNIVNFSAQRGKIYNIEVKAPYQINFTAPFFDYATFEVTLA